MEENFPYELNGRCWPEWIETQSVLFDPARLRQVGAEFSDMFARGVNQFVGGNYLYSGKVPVLAADDILAPENWRLDKRICGYDLPSFLCRKDNHEAEKRTVVLCATDPLRTWQQIPAVTVATPFGIHDPGIRTSRRSYGLVWRIACKLADAGYGVWLTDVHKLWFGTLSQEGEREIPKDVYTAMHEVLWRELRQVAPERVVAFGGHANWALRRQKDLGFSIVHVPHPAHYHKREWYFDDQAKEKFEDTADGRFEAKVDKFLSEIFKGPTEVPSVPNE